MEGPSDASALADDTQNVFNSILQPGDSFREEDDLVPAPSLQGADMAAKRALPRMPIFSTPLPTSRLTSRAVGGSAAGAKLLQTPSDEAEILSKIERAKQASAEDITQLKESLYAALADARAQINDHRTRAKDLQDTINKEIAIRAEVEHERDEAIRQAALLQAELDQLHRDYAALTHSDLASHLQQSLLANREVGEVNGMLRRIQATIQERDSAREEAQLLRDELATVQTLMAKNEVTQKELSVREEIRSLQEQRANTMRQQMKELETERDEHTRTIAALGRDLAAARDTIERFKVLQAGPTTTALAAERDEALAQVAVLRKQLGEARQEATANIARSASTEMVRQLEDALESALKQRDDARQEAKQARQEQGAKTSQDIQGKLQHAYQRINRLEELLSQQKQEHKLQRVLTSRNESLVQSLIDRNARIEAAAAFTIRNLEGEVASSRSKLNMTMQSKTFAELSGSQYPEYQFDQYGPTALAGAAEQQAAPQGAGGITIVGDPDTAKTLAVMLAKEKEIAVVTEALQAVRDFAQQVADGAWVSANVRKGNDRYYQLQQALDDMVQEAQRALVAADTSLVDMLPTGWERREAENFGLSYYIDHNAKMSTWIHPNLVPTALFANLAFVPEQFLHPQVPPEQHQSHSQQQQQQQQQYHQQQQQYHQHQQQFNQPERARQQEAAVRQRGVRENVYASPLPSPMPLSPPTYTPRGRNGYDHTVGGGMSTMRLLPVPPRRASPQTGTQPVSVRQQYHGSPARAVAPNRTFQEFSPIITTESGPPPVAESHHAIMSKLEELRQRNKSRLSGSSSKYVIRD